MVRRGGEDSSGEGTSWLVLRHTPAEGLGLLANPLRDFGVHHRYLDLPRGEPLPRDLRTVGGLIVLGGASITIRRQSSLGSAMWRTRIPPSEWVTAYSGRPAASAASASAIECAASAIGILRDG